QAAEKILVTKSPQPEAEAAGQSEAESRGDTETGDAASATDDTKLTFYDNLAKEETVPLGSGINLPPKPKEEKKPTVAPPIDLPDQPIVKKQAPAVVVAKGEAKAAKVAVVDSTGAMPKVDPKGTYSVQVGSFAAAGDAGAFKKRLLDKGYPAFVVEADLGAKGLWYRVRIGPYADAAAAKTVQQLAEKKEQIKGFISRQ
ncbi:MAG: SPOR domain-containing protein, partial [Desulfuromusa sp.]|nr:SPOR domain-containing protein [Desulfuromusa sp.]